MAYDSLFSVGITLLLVHYGASQRGSDLGGSDPQPECNVFLPSCRNKLQQPNNGMTHVPSFNKPNNNKCKYPDIWLIPGQADTTCTKPGAPSVIEIDPSTVKIDKKTIKLPGCFTIQFDIKVLDTISSVPSSYFGKAEYQWWNLQQFADLKCQNSSNNGCGGYGNNCYYCDICDQLSALDKNSNIHNQISKQAEGLVNQFKGIQCPHNPGTYRLTKTFCFNDWSVLDEDGDCKFDFLQAQGLTDYKSAFQSLQQIGFGTMVAKFRLATNATTDQQQKRKDKEEEIERIVRKELEERRASWDVSNGQFGTFQDWYIQYRKDLWHKNKYLPWLIYTNEVACLKVTFDVCDKEPTPATAAPRWGASWLPNQSPSVKCY